MAVKERVVTYPPHVFKGRTATYPLRLQELLRKKFFAKPYLPPQKKGPPYHNTQKILSEDLGNIESVVKEYLSVKPSLPILWGKTIVQFILLPPKPVRDKPYWVRPSFSDIVKGKSDVGNFCKRVASEIDKFEARLINEKEEEEDFIAAGSRNFLDLPKFAEHFAWVKVVRLFITVALIRALDYERIWKEADGDAGWWLSERVEQLAGNILELDEFKRLEKELQDKDTFLSSLGLSKKQRLASYEQLPYHFLTKELPIRSLLQDVAYGATTWRSWCKLKGCFVSEIGKQHPWTFNPIRWDLFTVVLTEGLYSLRPQQHPPYMYARKVAEARAIKVKDFWVYVKYTSGIIKDPKLFGFVLTAGTLQHGGAHPPHKTHRDGSMFDMDLIGLPPLVHPFIGGITLEPRSFIPDTDPTFGEEATVPREVPEDEEEGVLVATLPTEKILTIASEEKQKEYKKVAKKFTQCIYLTFPASAIYASDTILREAKDDLIKRVNTLVKDETDKDESTKDKKRIERLVKIQSLLQYPKLLQPNIKSDHADHWHINYNPDYLGDEGEIIKSANPELANTIKTALQILDEDDLWKELLKEEEKESDKK